MNIRRYLKAIESELHLLVSQDIINEDAAEKIRLYYREKSSSSPGVLVHILLGLAALLIGLGIILVFAYNWSSISVTVKTALVFSLLAGAQAYMWYSLFVGKSLAGREFSALFLCLMIGSAIALISQIYQLPGDFSVFLFVWILLALPLIYFSNSLAVCLFLILATVFLSNMSWGYQYALACLFLFASFLPFWFLEKGNNSQSYRLTILSWTLSASFALIVWDVLEHAIDHLSIILIVTLSFFLILVGEIYAKYMGKQLNDNPPGILGRIGTLIYLFLITYDLKWETFSVERAEIQDWGNILTVDTFIFLSLAAISLWLVFSCISRAQWRRILPYAVAPPLSIITLTLNSFLNEYSFPNASLVYLTEMILFNVYILALGLWITWKGVSNDSLNQINIGMLIILVLIATRFLDYDISIIGRGIIFIVLGIIFLSAGRIFGRLLKRKEQGNA